MQKAVMASAKLKKLAPVAVAVAALALYFGWTQMQAPDLPEGFAATEGDFVRKGDVSARVMFLCRWMWCS